MTWLKMPCGCMGDFTVYTSEPFDDRPRPVQTASDRDERAAQLEDEGWPPAAAAAIAAADLTDFHPLAPYEQTPGTDGLYAQGSLPAVVLRMMGFPPPGGDDAHVLQVTGPNGAQRDIAVTAQAIVHSEHPALLIRVVNVDADGDNTYGERLLDAWRTELIEHGFERYTAPSELTVTVKPGETASHPVQITIASPTYTLFTGPAIASPSWIARAEHLDGGISVFAGPLGFQAIPRDPEDHELNDLVAEGAVTTTIATVTRMRETEPVA